MECRWMNFCPSLEKTRETLIQEIREGKYKPNPVRRVEIPKETKGEYRKLGSTYSGRQSDSTGNRTGTHANL